VSVDNRYTGVGYEPAFETPSDKDFMASHIEALESRVRELEAERDEYKRQADGYYKEAAMAYETRNKAIELLSERYTNLNRDGKTILDFQNTWIRQTRDENDKLRVELKTCKAALAEEVICKNK